MYCGNVSTDHMSRFREPSDAYVVFCPDSLKCRIAAMMASYKYDRSYSSSTTVAGYNLRQSENSENGARTRNKV